MLIIEMLHFDIFKFSIFLYFHWKDSLLSTHFITDEWLICNKKYCTRIVLFTWCGYECQAIDLVITGSGLQNNIFLWCSFKIEIENVCSVYKIKLYVF